MMKELHEDFMELREMLGDDVIIDEIVNWLGAQSLMELIEHIEERYDLLSDDEEDDEDCEDDDEYDEEDYGHQDDDDDESGEESEDCDGGIEFT